MKALVHKWFVLKGLTNVEFHCGKAEDVFPNILNAIVSSNVTAIVDPPRAGLRESETAKMWIFQCCETLIEMICRFQGDPCHQEG